MVTGYKDEATLRHLYVDERKGAPTIADELGCGERTVYRWLERHGIETRPPMQDRPPRIRHDKDGYEVFIVRDGTDTRKVVRHHRLLAVAVYGFDAVVGMEVDHRTDIPWDNRHDAIRLMTPQEHSKESSAKHNYGKQTWEAV